MIADGHREGSAHAWMWPDEGPRFTEEDADRLLMWAADNDVSDVRLEPTKQIIVQRHGRVHRATRRCLNDREVERAANRFYNQADAMAHLKSRRDFNVAYEPGPAREWSDTAKAKRYRFRVNGANALQRGNDGPGLVVRPLAIDPWPLSRQDVEPDILDAMWPRHGLIVISGATGMGKSRLAAGMVLAKLQKPDSHRLINEYSAPIETVFDGHAGPTSEIKQIEIGRHLETFAAGVRHAVRDNADEIVIGECRDGETMTAAISAAQADHAVTLTMHAGSLYETFERAVSMCPANVRSEMTVAMAQGVRLVVNQRLIWSADGTRTPIREWMICDRDIRRMLGTTDPRQWPQIMENMARARRTDFEHSIRRALAEGRITETVALKHIAELRE